MRKRYVAIFALLFVSVFMFSRVGYPWGSTGGDGARYGQLRETAVFFNNSGSTITSGSPLVLDTSGTGVAAGTTLGSYVTTTTTADASWVVGVAYCPGGECTYLDQSPVIVVTRGPAECSMLAVSDPFVQSDWIGTGTTAGNAGRHVSTAYLRTGIVGWAMEDDGGVEFGHDWIWVDPR